MSSTAQRLFSSGISDAAASTRGADNSLTVVFWQLCNHLCRGGCLLGVKKACQLLLNHKLQHPCCFNYQKPCSPDIFQAFWQVLDITLLSWFLPNQMSKEKGKKKNKCQRDYKNSKMWQLRQSSATVSREEKPTEELTVLASLTSGLFALCL